MLTISRCVSSIFKASNGGITHILLLCYYPTAIIAVVVVESIIRYFQYMVVYMFSYGGGMVLKRLFCCVYVLNECNITAATTTTVLRL